MKEKFIRSIVIVSGVAVTYSKYKNLELIAFINLEYLYPILIFVIVLFFVSIIYLNKKVYKLKTVIINKKIFSLLNRIDLPSLKKNERNENIKTKKEVVNRTNGKLSIIKLIELLIWLIGALGFGYFLGYYFKTFNSVVLERSLYEESKWEREAFLELVDSKIHFFSLGSDNPMAIYGGFNFNWLAFFLGIVIILIMYFIVKKTTIINILKVKIQPFLK
jgi:hypothetical protein